MIDLHSHSSCSDGILTPTEFARYAAEKNMSVWALTDHDTVDGLSEAAKACLDTNINFIPGIELNISWSNGEFHLLGLGLKTYSPELKDVISYLTESRNERNMQIVKKMNEDGFCYTLEEIESSFSASQIGRPHFADFLVKKGFFKTRQDVFNKYLGRGHSWFFQHNGEDLDAAIEGIVTSGGIPVLAHPMSLYVSWGNMESVLTDIFNKGVKGLEAFHPGARNSECYRLEELAKKIGFFVTAGSDFHGVGVRSDRHLGKLNNGKKIDYKFWEEELKPALGDFDYKKTDWIK